VVVAGRWRGEVLAFFFTHTASQSSQGMLVVSRPISRILLLTSSPTPPACCAVLRLHPHNTPTNTTNRRRQGLRCRERVRLSSAWARYSHETRMVLVGSAVAPRSGLSAWQFASHGIVHIPLFELQVSGGWGGRGGVWWSSTREWAQVGVGWGREGVNAFGVHACVSLTHSIGLYWRLACCPASALPLRACCLPLQQCVSSCQIQQSQPLQPQTGTHTPHQQQQQQQGTWTAPSLLQLVARVLA
jgi:hypothetical protein